jgi:hypothetical protein
MALIEMSTLEQAVLALIVSLELFSILIIQIVWKVIIDLGVTQSSTQRILSKSQLC